MENKYNSEAIVRFSAKQTLKVLINSVNETKDATEVGAPPPLPQPISLTPEQAAKFSAAKFDQHEGKISEVLVAVLA